jgi:putative sigma-54 modulation protein
VAARREASRGSNGSVGVLDEDEDVGGPRIVKAKRFSIKPMTPTEAALQMDLLGHAFYFFTNSDTERAAVIYRRDDGDLGLIDEAG